MDEQTRYQIGRRVSWLTIIANILLAAVKAGVGLLYGSSVLIADAVHSLSDVATTVVVLFAMRIAKAPPDAEHPYGHGRAESIGAKVLAVMLVPRSSAQEALPCASSLRVPSGCLDIGHLGFFSIVVKKPCTATPWRWAGESTAPP